MGKQPKVDLPRSHPAIDMSSIKSVRIHGIDYMAAEVTCARCGKKRWRPLSSLRQELASPNFTGWCKPCNGTRQSVPRRLDLPRKHPSIDSANIEPKFIYGHQVMAAKVTCPTCKAERWYPLSILRQQLRRENFNGQCKPCGHKASRAGVYQWQKRKNGGRRNLSTNGYIQLGPTYVDAADLPMFRAMQGKGGFVLEHRWVMAKHLGRPLTSAECVDHMSGVKTHNKIENLRMYVRGKQQPGSCPAHGTYYHEWQMALRRIRKLEARLKRHERLPLLDD